MFCPKCGKENIEGAQLCSSCSWVLSSVSAQPTPDAKTSGAATAALILGILAPFTCLLTTIPAVICGVVGLVKISKSQGRLKGNGFAIAGIAIPFAAIQIVAMMLAIIMPALAKTRQLAFRMICGTNMSSIGKAMMTYSDDYGGMYPTSSKWCDLLEEKADVSENQFQCKGAPEKDRCNYAMNKNVEKLGTHAPPDMVLVFDSGPGWNQSGGAELITANNHQGDGCNVLFVDGHVEFVNKKDIPKLKWTADPNG